MLARVALALALATALPAVAAPPTASPKAVYQRAKALYDEGQFEEAGRLFLEVYTLTRRPLLLFNAAQAQRKAGRASDAATLYHWFIEQAQDEGGDLVSEARTHLATLQPARAVAAPATECRDGEDCGPGEVCQGGRCGVAAAAPRVARPLVPPPSVYVPPTSGDPTAVPGWSYGAGVSGIIFSIITLGLGMGAEGVRTHQTPAMSLGIVATLTFGVDTPITAAGAFSTRLQTGVPGNLGLRVTGWISFALGMVGACALIGLGAQAIAPPPGVIAATTLVGTTGNLFLAIDGLIGHAQARERRARAASARVRWVAPTAMAF